MTQRKPPPDNHCLAIAIIAIIFALFCCCFMEGCCSLMDFPEPPNCVARACAVGKVAAQHTCVRIVCGWYDPAPLVRPGGYHAECQYWNNGRWEFCELDEWTGLPKSKGTAIYGFEVREVYQWNEFLAVAQKNGWGSG